MAETPPAPAPVIDQRVAPRGVLPRHTQTWLMVGLAIGILAIIVFAGRPEPAAGPAGAATAAAPPDPDPARLRDFQDRLKVIDARTRHEQTVATPEVRGLTPVQSGDSEPVRETPPEDPLDVERKRREYESLFASNIVTSLRPDGQRLTTPGGPVGAQRAYGTGHGALAPPSIDDVADAVVRATSRYGASPGPTVAPSGPPGPPPGSATAQQAPVPGDLARPAFTGPITSSGPLHRLVEGTVIDVVLTNRLDGSVAAPVNCLVTNAVYSHDGQHVLIPAGARVIGETKPVEALGDTRLAVTFHRLVMPDGSSYKLDHVTGLNQVGDAGLHDQVDRHYWSTFGASGAVGVISGLAQVLGGAGFGGDGDRTVVITGGVGNAASQATAQTMNRFLNRLPTVTIREGHRVKVYLTADLNLPPYQQTGSAPAIRAADRLAGVRQ